MMSRCTAQSWLDLAVTLRWRLAATGGALAAGVIDLPRARLIAEATSLLAEEDARTVEAQVLPRAGELTSAGLRPGVSAAPGGCRARRTGTPGERRQYGGCRGRQWFADAEYERDHEPAASAGSVCGGARPPGGPRR